MCWEQSARFLPNTKTIMRSGTAHCLAYLNSGSLKSWSRDRSRGSLASLHRSTSLRKLSLSKNNLKMYYQNYLNQRLIQVSRLYNICRLDHRTLNFDRSITTKWLHQAIWFKRQMTVRTLQRMTIIGQRTTTSRSETYIRPSRVSPQRPKQATSSCMGDNHLKCWDTVKVGTINLIRGQERHRINGWMKKMACLSRR